MSTNPTTIQPKQEILQLNTLYLCSGVNIDNTSIKVDTVYQNVPNIWIKGGSVDIYLSNDTTKPNLVSDMTLNAEDTGVSGCKEINVVTRWIYIKQNTSTTTKIIASGIDVEAYGNLGG